MWKMGLRPRYSQWDFRCSAAPGGTDRLGSALVRRLVASLDAHEARLRAEDRRQSIRLEWQQLALVIDR